MIKIALALVLMIVPWSLYLVERSRAKAHRCPAPARLETHPAEAPSIPATVDPVIPERLAQAQVVVTEDERRVRDYESRLKEAESAIQSADDLRAVSAWSRILEILEPVTLPTAIELRFLDPAPLQLRLKTSQCRLAFLKTLARSELLKVEAPPATDDERATREQMTIKLSNKLAELQRRVIAIANGIEEKADVTDERAHALGRLQAFKVSLQMDKVLSSNIVEYLREFTGLNIVLGMPELADRCLSLNLKDIPAEGIVAHVAAQLGTTWSIDRYGIVIIGR